MTTVSMLTRYHEVVREASRPRFMGADLASKITAAEALGSPCRLCERSCGSDRWEGEKGSCGVLEPLVTSDFIHFGEEPELVPSHTVFFAGCNFRCAFCQNWDISQQPECGAAEAPATLADRIMRGGGINVNWVGGDPTPNLPFVLKVMAELKENDIGLAQIWNSNMYMSKEAMNILDGTIDLYLSDFKYGNDRCAKRLSGVDRYFEIVGRNHLRAASQCEILLRHLVLPGHIDCCTRPVLDWVASNIPKNILRVNVMDQYHPDFMVLRDGAKYGELVSRLRPREYLEACEYARKLGLDLV